MFSLTGNPGITDPRVNSGPSTPASPASPNGGGTKSKTNIPLIAGVVAGIVGAIVVIGCVATIWIVLWRKKNGSRLSNSKSSESSKGIDEILHVDANYNNIAQYVEVINGASIILFSR